MNHSETRRSAAPPLESRENPAITAIVTTRNSESHIRACLSGLMKQGVADHMEVIVVDQGSEQAEAAIVADLQRQHSALISLRIPTAHSAYAGVDLALRIASGRYLTILDAGDRMGEESYQMLSAALGQHPEAMMAYEVATHPMWRRELHEAIGGFGSGDQALSDFMEKAAQRFSMRHALQSTAVKLLVQPNSMTQEVPTMQMQQETPEQEAPPAPLNIVVRDAKAGMTAEERYAGIQQVVNGADHLQGARAIEEHLQRHPDHAMAHNDLAAIYYRMGEKEQSLQHYRRAVELAPEESTYQKNLADMLYVEAGEVDEAIAIYLELHKKSPRDVETLLNLGIISLGVGQPAEAESFLERALEIEPWNQTVRERLTELRDGQSEAVYEDDDQPAEERYEKVQGMVQKGEVDAAIHELEAILTVHPDFAPAHNDLAVLDYQAGDKEGALVHYEKAAALVPGNGTFQKNLADFYFVERRNVDGAIAIYLDQLAKEPRNIDTLMNLGKICAMLDRPHEAETFYGKVTQLEPWNQAARECLSNLRHCANA